MPCTHGAPTLLQAMTPGSFRRGSPCVPAQLEILGKGDQHASVFCSLTLLLPAARLARKKGLAELLTACLCIRLARLHEGCAAFQDVDPLKPWSCSL